MQPDPGAAGTWGRRSVAEHQKAVRELLAPLAGRLGTDELPLSGREIAARPDAYTGRILAADLLAATDLPPFDNSQMDGYAVHTAELRSARPEAPVELAVAGTIAAGDPVGELAPGQAAPIMTGAAIPLGADAVIPIEQADPARFDPRLRTVRFTQPVNAGDYLRAQGSDIRAGSLLLKSGSPLGAAQWGSLAAAGITRVPVRRRVRVLLVSTGHELGRPDQPLKPGQIHDANSVALAAALTDAGAVVNAEVSADRVEEFVDVLQRFGPDADLVLTTGGVSAGAFEVVRLALGDRGVAFGSVAMQPGGPQGVGNAELSPTGTVPAVCFPGNPVSALVSFEMFLRPVLARLAGARHPDRVSEEHPLAHSVDSPAAKHQVRRGRLNPEGRVELVGGPGSHLLHSYAASSVLVHLPAGVEHLEASAPVTIWRIDA